MSRLLCLSWLCLSWAVEATITLWLVLPSTRHGVGRLLPHPSSQGAPGKAQQSRCVCDQKRPWAPSTCLSVCKCLWLKVTRASYSGFLFSKKSFLHYARKQRTPTCGLYEGGGGGGEVFCSIYVLLFIPSHFMIRFHFLPPHPSAWI